MLLLTVPSWLVPFMLVLSSSAESSGWMANLTFLSFEAALSLREKRSYSSIFKTYLVFLLVRLVEALRLRFLVESSALLVDWDNWASGLTWGR